MTKPFGSSLLLFLAACGGGGDSPGVPGPPRAFGMGFTPWPNDATTSAVSYTYARIQDHGDWIAHHLDQGIPWQEALHGSAYPAAVEAELADRVASTPVGHKVYLAITPINGLRTGMAENWGDGGSEPLPAPWDTRQLDDAETIQAFSQYAVDLASRFQPDCMNLAIEASELALNDAAAYQRFVTLIEPVANAVRAAHPNLPLMISIGLKTPGSSAANTILNELPAAIQWIDWVGVSVYPYLTYDHADKGDPANLPVNWLSQIDALAAGKPVAITETGWIAEDLEVPTYSLSVASDEGKQNAYLEALFEQAEQVDAKFIVWFSFADFDALWAGALGESPLAHLWRDTGLVDGTLQARPSLTTWGAQLAKPLNSE